MAATEAPVLVVRPPAEAAALAAQLRAEGFPQAIAAPVLDAVAVPSPPPPLEPAPQAVLLTSARSLAFLPAAALERLRPLPCFCVGSATAEAARAAGFSTVSAGEGAASALVPPVAARCDPAAGPLLHLSGTVLAQDPAALLAPLGFVTARWVLYAMQVLPALPAPARAALQGTERADILLFSAEAARAFCQLAGELPLQRHRALCLSPRVAAALPPGRFAAIQSAARPDSAALLELLDRSAR